MSSVLKAQMRDGSEQDGGTLHFCVLASVWEEGELTEELMSQHPVVRKACSTELQCQMKLIKCLNNPRKITANVALTMLLSFPIQFLCELT